jgi:hypothetical protein
MTGPTPPRSYTFNKLLPLWPRVEGAIWLLHWVVKDTLAGKVPCLTDSAIGKKVRRSPTSVARWREHWESMGILVTQQQGRHIEYLLNFEALDKAIAQVKAAEAEAELAAQMKVVARRAEQEQAMLQRLTSPDQLEKFSGISKTQHNASDRPNISGF